jgi:hypothetical protein
LIGRAGEKSLGCNRRDFLKNLILLSGGLSLKRDLWAMTSVQRHPGKGPQVLYRAVNGSPEQNLEKVVELMGGIEKVIGKDDVVIVKPNAQWWNQGTPNLAALKRFVELLIERPGGFRGEVVLAENCHRGNSPGMSSSSAWTVNFIRNSDVDGVRDLNGLSHWLTDRYGKRFSVCHWVDVMYGARRVYGPGDGPGYVYCDGSGGIPRIAVGSGGRWTIMTYPIFATGQGTVIDFQKGIWEKGAYTGRPLRFINFAALNHHSIYCGMTSALKNYMGISDLSGGPDPNEGGRLTKDDYNFHSFAFNKWSDGPTPGALGEALGVFMNTIRKADWNIVTAEWTGISSRTTPLAAHTRAVLACQDPVALDHHSAKYILFPNSELDIHNPDNLKGPLYQTLLKCAETKAGVFDGKEVEVRSFDFRANRFQKAGEWVINGKKVWGDQAKPILKYLVLRSRQVFF